jgi:SAM-dependent methyltransferase
VVADIGCSIGTFAIEFAKAGYQSYGLDFDPAAIERARLLAGEEGVQPTFLCRNMLAPDLSLPPVDVAVCFDIFEHVHDDQLGSLLYALKRRLSPQGTIIFHTFPTYYDYIFYAGRGWHYPLLPFRGLPAPAFRRLTRVYATLLDALLLAKNGLNYRDAIADAGHCNPTTAQRLRDILRRADYRILSLDTGRLFPNKPAIQRLFRKQPVADRHIFGVAAPFGEPSGPGGL